MLKALLSFNVKIRIRNMLHALLSFDVEIRICSMSRALLSFDVEIKIRNMLWGAESRTPEIDASEIPQDLTPSRSPTYTCTYIYHISIIHLYVYGYSYIYVYLICIYIYIYIYRERERDRERERERQRERYTHMCTCIAVSFIKTRPRDKTTIVRVYFRGKTNKIKEMFHSMIPHQSNCCLAQRLATQVSITLHDTTDLQHLHNPTTLLNTLSCYHTCIIYMCPTSLIRERSKGFTKGDL